MTLRAAITSSALRTKLSAIRIDALFKTHHDILPVFLSHRVDVYFGTRQVDPLVRTEQTADNHPALDVGRDDLFDSQFNVAVRQKDRMSDGNLMRQTLERDRSAASIATDVIRRQYKFLPRLQLHDSRC